MKRLIRLSIAVMALATCMPQTTKAAFPIKQETQQAAVTEQTTPPAAVAATAGITTSSDAATATVVKKKGFFGRLFSHIKQAASNTIPIVLYIVMCILPLGWLAIGLNEDWQTLNWLLALILYFIFYLPGVVFSLIMAGKYY